MGFEIIAYFGTACSIVGYAFSTMIPLRILGLLSSSATLTYGYLTWNVPLVVSGCILIPLNLMRLAQMLWLVKAVQAKATDRLEGEWLKPFATRRHCAKGEILFRQGDPAGEMFCIVSGRFRLIESGRELSKDELVGELGLLSPDNRRTQGMECLEAGELLRLGYEDFKQLYYQNPQFGFYFLRLVADRMFENSKRNEMPALPNPL